MIYKKVDYIKMSETFLFKLKTIIFGRFFDILTFLTSIKPLGFLKIWKNREKKGISHLLLKYFFTYVI